MSKYPEKRLIRLCHAGTDKDNLPERRNQMLLTVFSLVMFTSIGLFLKSKNPPAGTPHQKTSPVQTRFIFEENKPVTVIEKKRPEPQKKIQTVQKEAPLDLTRKPEIKQKPEQEQELPEQPKQKPDQQEEAKPVRRVYGLKKVYSSGIGASGDASSAIIGKLGNTLDTPIDTFKVTREELQGRIASVASVTTLPRLKFQIKPEYTREMLENRIEGLVRVKVLIDIDGKVKKVILLDDLGYGSKEKIYEACMKLEFEPAYQGDTPRASWQLIRFRFEMIQG